MNFDDGNQNNNDKNNEFRVRPVRRFDCCTLPVPRPGAGLLRLQALQAQQRQRTGLRGQPRAEPVTATQRPDRRHLPARPFYLLRGHPAKAKGSVGCGLPRPHRAPPALQPYRRPPLSPTAAPAFQGAARCTPPSGWSRRYAAPPRTGRGLSTTSSWTWPTSSYRSTSRSSPANWRRASVSRGGEHWPCRYSGMTRAKTSKCAALGTCSTECRSTSA